MTARPNFQPAAPPLWHALRVTGLLIWNDVRQGVRRHLAAQTTRDKLLRAGGVLFGLAFMAGLHVCAFAVVSYASLSPSRDLPALMAGLSTAIWSFLIFVMLSGGLVRALVVLHEQDDSSLLLASPVSPRAVLAGRLFGNALQSCLVDGFIIVPYINVRIFAASTLQWHFLWGYAVWFALAVVVTCIDGLFSFGLIRWLGLRRARFFAQAVPFLLIFGVTLFAGAISVSIAQLSPDSAHMPPEMQAHFIALAHSPMSALAWAAAGRSSYYLPLFAGTAVLAWVTLWLTERAFLEGSRLVAENEGPAPGARSDGPFRSGLLRLEVSKNLRLVTRTPMMTVQCIAQALMPVGIACLLGRDDLGLAVAFFVIFAAGVLSGMFTLASGTVEECGDLLAMSPRVGQLFRFGKIASGALFPLGAVVVVAVGLLVVGEVRYALAVFFAGVPLGLASSICGETFAMAVKPGVRPKLMADPIMMVPLLGTQIISGTVAGGCVFAAATSWTMLALALLATYMGLVVIVGLAQLRKPLF
jgi:ABC-2 type transport system permease protein